MGDKILNTFQILLFNNIISPMINSIGTRFYFRCLFGNKKFLYLNFRKIKWRL